MVKKVKAYLNNAEIIEDEDRLLDIVGQCEPGENPRPVFFSFERTIDRPHRS
jgi:hypothetical protein